MQIAGSRRARTAVVVVVLVAVVAGLGWYLWPSRVRHDGPLNVGFVNFDGVGQGMVKSGDVWTLGYDYLVNSGDSPATISSIELIPDPRNPAGAVEVGPYMVSGPDRRAGQITIGPGFPPTGDFSMGELEPAAGHEIPVAQDDPKRRGVLVAVRMEVKRAEYVAFWGLRVRYTYGGRPYEHTTTTTVELCPKDCPDGSLRRVATPPPGAVPMP